MPPSSSTKPNFLPRLNQLTRPFAIQGVIFSLPVSPSTNHHERELDPAHGYTLQKPVFRRIEVGKNGMVWSIEPPKARLQVPVPCRTLVLVREAGQHRHEPLLVGKDQHPFFIASGRDPNGLKREAHAASCLRCRCK